MTSTTQSLTLTALVSLISAQAFAWGDLGHQATAEVAQRHLTDKARSLVMSTMTAEPMALSATWPDSVRRDKTFDELKPYHFAEIKEGQAYPEGAMREDAYAVLRNAKVLLQESDHKDVKSSDTAAVKKQKIMLAKTRKAMLLRYLIHVAGDVHQPLHVGNGVDFGANACSVTLELGEDPKPVVKNLHAYWDDSVVELIKDKYQAQDAAVTGKMNYYFGYFEIASSLDKKYASTVASEKFQAELSAEDPLKWILEARDLRMQYSYPDKIAGFDPKRDGGDIKRFYCKLKTAESTEQNPFPHFDKTKIPTLKEKDEFVQQSVSVAELQILKGGHRLAALLNAIAKDMPASASTPDFPSLELVIKSLKDRWLNP